MVSLCSPARFRSVCIRVVALVVLFLPLAGGAQSGPVMLHRLPALKFGLGPVRFAAGTYFMPGGSGQVLFSADGMTWDHAVVGSAATPIKLQHDGQRWVAANRDEELAFSADLKTWTPFFPGGKAAAADALFWRGKFWLTTDVMGIMQAYSRGHVDGEAIVMDRDWDGQINGFQKPAFFWRAGDRLQLLLQDGHAFASDNGEYWETIGSYPTREAKKVYYAEGNNLAVTAIETKAEQGAPVLMSVATATGSPEEIVAPVTKVSGVVFGAGRFVMVGRPIDAQLPALFESFDGRTWRALAQLSGDAPSLAFGPGGFLAYVGFGDLYVYNPMPAPETPMPAKAPTPIPDVFLKDFGQNYTGKGKYRKNTGPETPDQFREQELQGVLSRAHGGDVAAKLEMALVLVEAKYALTNPWRAELWFKEAREAGAPSAARGYAQLLKTWKPDTTRTAILDLYRESATLGDVVALRWLAVNLSTTDAAESAEIPRWRDAALAADPAFAAVWERHELWHANIAAAEAGEVDAIFKVLPLMLDGEAVPKDLPKALELNDKAVQQGKYNGSVYLISLFQGQFSGPPEKKIGLSSKDYARLLEEVVAGGYRPAFGQLMNNLMSGQFGYDVNEPRAYAMALELAQAGDVEGMVLTATILMKSRGKTKNETEAAEWFKKAAAAGHAGAQNWLKQQEAVDAEKKTRALAAP